MIKLGVRHHDSRLSLWTVSFCSAFLSARGVISHFSVIVSEKNNLESDLLCSAKNLLNVLLVTEM